jgi:D-serine deaminase-like pyridoxal phosphate-dependent protein
MDTFVKKVTPADQGWTHEVRSGVAAAISRGMPVTSLPTPALLMDMDAMERNLIFMAKFFGSVAPKLRPHFKAHQVFSLAKRQIQNGAIGLTCARLDQAEALVNQGISNILVANEVAGESKIRHFVDLSRRAPIIVAVDNPKIVSDLARLAGDHQRDLNVLVDVDVRLGRCGVKPGEAALSLTKLVLDKGLRFRGLMGYEGQVALPPGSEKERVVCESLTRLADTKTMIENEGVRVEIVSCGGTSDFAVAARYPQVTEIQAGSYLLMDSSYIDFAPEFEPTLSILGTVISKTLGERIVVDAGCRAMSGEHGLPSVKEACGLRVKALHIEHTVIEMIDPNVDVEVGDKIELSVQFLDQTLGLHDHLYGVRKGVVEEVLKIEH